jgi:hypothetical protein
VDDAEDCRIRANSQRQRDERDAGKARRLRELPHGEAHIVKPLA